MFELNDNELANIAGGVLTPEAEAWIARNKNEVVSRAPLALRGLVDTAINAVKNAGETYDVAALKAALKSYKIDADDLD